MVDAAGKEGDMSQPPGERPLAVRIPNWVGDVVMAVPTLQQLKRSGWNIVLFGRRWAKDLLAGLETPIYAIPSGVLPASRQLRTLGLKRGLLLTNSFSSAAAMRLAGISAIGHRADGRGLLLGKKLDKPTDLHEVEVFWRLGRAACEAARLPEDAWPAEPPPRIELPRTQAHRDEAAAVLERHSVQSPYIVCCPLAVGLIEGQSRVWPEFPNLAARLLEQGSRVVACPGPGEEAACREALPGATILPGVSLGAYAEVLAGAAKVAANDSGPMHLAAAVGAPVLGIFGISNPQRTRPWGGQYIGSTGQWPSLEEVFERLDHLPAADA
jgi:heptosyltransferase-2